MAGAVDESYLIMLNELENGLRGKELGEDSELRKIQGILDDLGVITLPDGNRLIVRGDSCPGKPEETDAINIAFRP